MTVPVPQAETVAPTVAIPDPGPSVAKVAAGVTATSTVTIPVKLMTLIIFLIGASFAPDRCGSTARLGTSTTMISLIAAACSRVSFENRCTLVRLDLDEVEHIRTVTPAFSAAMPVISCMRACISGPWHGAHIGLPVRFYDCWFPRALKPFIDGKLSGGSEGHSAQRRMSGPAQNRT